MIDSIAQTERKVHEVAFRDARTQIAIGLWHKWADVSHIEWEDESHKAEYLMAVDDITNLQLLNLLISRLHYDGANTNSLTVGEIRRAIDAAPPTTPPQ